MKKEIFSIILLTILIIALLTSFLIKKENNYLSPDEKLKYSLTTNLPPKAFIPVPADCQTIVIACDATMPIDSLASKCGTPCIIFMHPYS